MDNKPNFKADFFETLAKVEATNFWFKSRNRLINWAIKKYFSDADNFFEIGCGTGFVLSDVEKKFPQLKLFGSEIFSEGLEFAAKRIKNATLLQMDARNIPFENKFNVIGAFDVLEHIEEDELVLQQIFRALKPNGGIIITVPQHMFLWSQQDTHACHVRRYSVKELKTKVLNAGFKIVRTTSFVSLLLPFMVASRLIKLKSESETYDPFAEFKLPLFLNFLFEKTLNFESLLISLGVQLPIGGSLLLIAQRK